METSKSKEQNVATPPPTDAQAHIYHIDGRVTAIEGQISGVVNQLNRMEAALLNKPPILNFGNVMTMMLMLAGLLYGINSFVDLRLVHLKDAIQNNSMEHNRIDDRIAKQEEFQREMHFEVGGFRSVLKEAEDRRARNENWIRGVDGRVREVEKQAAASEVSRRAIGNFVEDVDKYGSRRWIDKGAP